MAEKVQIQSSKHEVRTMSLQIHIREVNLCEQREAEQKNQEFRFEYLNSRPRQPSGKIMRR